MSIDIAFNTIFANLALYFRPTDEGKITKMVSKIVGITIIKKENSNQGQI